MSDYESIAAKSWGDIPKDKVLPVGSWLLRLRNAAYVESNDPQVSNKFLFFYQVREPMSDVTPEALSELNGYDVTMKQIVKTFWVETPRNWDEVRAHFGLLGIETPDTKSLPDTIKEAKGHEIISYLDTKTFQNSQGEMVTDNNPVSFAAVE